MLVHTGLPPYIFLTFYLFFRERGKEREKEGEKQLCVRETLIGYHPNAPTWGLGPQARHVPSPGIEPATLQLAGQ